MNNSSLCDIARSISSRIELNIIYIFELIFALIAIFPNLLTLTLLWRVKIFHANLRLILANLSFNLLIFSCSTVHKVIHRLIMHPCNLPILFRSCVLWDLLTSVIPVQNALFTLVNLSVERLYATIRYRTYDFSGSIPFLAIFLVVSAWAITITIDIPGYIEAPADLWVPICETALVMKREGVEHVVALLVTLETTAAILMIYVYVYNRFLLSRMALNRARYNLSARFQVNQNVQVNNALFPGMLLHIACYLPTYILLFTVFGTENNLRIEMKAWLLHLTILWRQIYAAIDPILLVTLNSNLRQAVKRMKTVEYLRKTYRTICNGGNRVKEGNGNATVNEMNAHFAYLRELWNGPT